MGEVITLVLIGRVRSSKRGISNVSLSHHKQAKLIVLLCSYAGFLGILFMLAATLCFLLLV